MNIQTDPSLLKGVIEPLPASADQPIRSTFFHEANMRKFGEELAQTRPAVPGLRRIRIPAPHPRERQQDPRSLSRDQRRAGEGRDDHAGRAVAARQPLPDRRDGLPGEARPAAPLLQGASGRIVRRRPAGAARAGHRLGLRRAFRQLGLGLDVRGDRRRLPVGRAAQDRRIVGAAVAAAFRADREPAPAGACASTARASCATSPTRSPTTSSPRATAKARPAILARYAAHARDTTFTTQLLYRLRDGSRNAGRALVWLENELESHGTNAEAMIIAEHQTLSSGNVTTANIVRGLRLINDVDWTVWFEKVSRVDALLREQALFADLDFHSRDLYRAEIEELARGSGITEYAVAEHADRQGQGGGCRRPRYVGHRLLPGRRTSRRAGSGDRLPAALRHPLQARLSQGRLGRASSVRLPQSPPSCCR